MAPGGVTREPGTVYSATYSHVPVYEFLINGEQIMRRRKDDYVNATHILKAADFDKPARTRILEREVQKGIHEKVQGGYGKYQGTWIPLAEARALAKKNNVMEKLRPLLDFVPGDQSPPPAPKHATAASKPKAPRQSVARKVAPPNRTQMSEVSYDIYSTRDTPARTSMRSDSPGDFAQDSRFSTGQHRKRKRNMEEPATMSWEDQNYLLWADELLDFFMLQDSAEPLAGPPDPPAGADMNRAMDDKGHMPLHWASAMGDTNVVVDLLRRGARVDARSSNGETPLMRAVMFTNNYDKQTMDRLAEYLISTAGTQDICASNVFHHIAATTCSKSKYTCARYYTDTILAHMHAQYSKEYIADVLDQRDQNGDTAILIAARFGARKCVRSLQSSGASINIKNYHNETADTIIAQLNARRRERHGVSANIMSSSPIRDDSGFGSQSLLDGNAASAMSRTPTKRQRISYRSEAATILATQLPVLISTRTEALAAALETDLIAREAEVNEGDAVLEARREEIQRLREEHQYLQEDLDENPEDVEVGTELQALEQAVLELLEVEQSQELAVLVEAEQKKGRMVNGNSPQSDNRVALAEQLVAAQSERKDLAVELIGAVGSAADINSLLGDDEYGNGGSESQDRQNAYKRLIRIALSMSEEEEANIKDLLPEIVRELEDSKRDRNDGVIENSVADVNMGVSGDFGTSRMEVLT